MKDALDKLILDVKDIQAFAVRVGVVGDRNEKLLAIHELGTKSIPARAPLRSGFANKKDHIFKIADGLVASVITGKTELKKAAEAIGQTMKVAIQTNLSSGMIRPELAESTIENRARRMRKPKGNRPRTDKVPLYDTGHLLGSFEYEVKYG